MLHAEYLISNGNSTGHNSVYHKSEFGNAGIRLGHGLCSTTIGNLAMLSMNEHSDVIFGTQNVSVGIDRC